MGLYTSQGAGAGLLSELFELYVRLYVRPRVTGREQLPREGAYILAPNHASHADTAVLYAVLPLSDRRRLLAAAAQDYFFVGGLRQWTVRTLFNAIPVEREGIPGRDPLRHVVRALREGYGVLLFPEGTRSTNGEIGRFRSGIGRLVAHFPGVPVVPVHLQGTADVLPKGGGLPLPRRVAVRFGAPMYLQAGRRDRASWQAAADQVREAVVALGAEGLAPPTPPEAPPADEEPADGRNERSFGERAIRYVRSAARPGGERDSGA
jgi:1-acyl-sn-glycerol-3-phosphate acyltransferase